MLRRAGLDAAGMHGLVADVLTGCGGSGETTLSIEGGATIFVYAVGGGIVNAAATAAPPTPPA